MPAAFADLRARLVREIGERGALHTAAVAAAFEAVPRHLFLPGISPEDAYADRAIPVKFERDVPISSSSQPAMMAEMLEQLAVRPGERILEIGAGTGYNAALLAVLAGPDGFVSTVELDDDLAAAARSHLTAAGFPAVRVLRRDGAQGDAAHAPFDALIATVAAGDVPRAWFAQVRAGGRLVMPLALRGSQKIVCFERSEAGLRSTSIVDGGFMMLRGDSPSVRAIVVELGGGASIRGGKAAGVDADLLRIALRAPVQVLAASRLLDAEEVWLSLAFWIAAHDDAFCRVTVTGTAALTTPVPDLTGALRMSPAPEASTLGLVRSGALVVFAARDDRSIELHAFGDAGSLVARMQHAITEWDDAGRPGNERLRIEIVPRSSGRPARSPPGEPQALVELPSARAAVRWAR